MSSEFKAKVQRDHNFRKFKEAPLSKEPIEAVQLEAIDLSLYKEGPENFQTRKLLANKLEKSLSTYGFITVTNHGIDTEQLEYLKSLGQAVCELPDEEQAKYLAGALRSDLEDRSKSIGAEHGAGYKPRGYWSMRNGVNDSIVHYNFRKMLHPDFFDTEANNYPVIVKAHLDEIAEYFNFLHNSVLRKLTILTDIVLEIPEGTLWEHYFKAVPKDYENSGQGVGRFMLYHNMKPEDEKKVGKNWLRGHSDSGGFTFITSQPILSLQIRDYFSGEWKYVGHVPNSLIVNIGDAMEFITGGYFKSSVHRVVSPPDDQKAFRRLVLIYFSGPNNHAVLDPEPLKSPKLQRLGFVKPLEWDKIEFSEWNIQKASLFGRKNINDSKSEEPNLVLIHGRLHERWHQVEANFNIVEARKRFNVIEI